MLFLSIAQPALVKGVQSYSSLSYFPCYYPKKFLEHKPFGNASLPLIVFQVQIPSVASLQGRAGTEGPVNWSRNEDLCSSEAEKVAKKSACSKASSKNFGNQLG